MDRRGTHASKWERYAGRDILPFWVADMDFPAAPFLLDALHKRLQHGILGYTETPESLTDAFLGWLDRHYGWRARPEWLVWIAGVVPGTNLAAAASAMDASVALAASILIPTPVYYPFLSVPANVGMGSIEAPMRQCEARWEMDFDAMEAAVDANTRMILIANPQNPTGRVYTEAELLQLARFAERHDLVICSDEIHCSLVLDPGAQHIPIASLAPEIGARTISLYSATKAYNIPGLSCAVAVIPDQHLRQGFRASQRGLVTRLGPLGIVATEAAFRDKSDWLPELLDYLRDNHALVQAAVGERMISAQATCLAWIDVRDLEIANIPAHFERFGLGLSNGADFAGPGFVRFNFGCPRSLLKEGLERLKSALR